MKIGQLVMLIRTSGVLPPIGATGEIHSECCMDTGRRVMFSRHKNMLGDGAFCVHKTWLIPIDDADGEIAKEGQLELDYSDRIKERISKLREKYLEVKIDG